MIYRALLTLIVLIGAWLNLNAQVSEFIRQQIIEHKDGSRLLGTVISNTDYSVSLVLLTGDTLDIGFKYIESVGDTDDSRVYRVSFKKVRLPKKHISKNIINSLSIGGSVQGDEGAAGLNINTQVMKMLNDKFGLGIGSGYMTYNKVISF